jgi:hypothetical protein
MSILYIQFNRKIKSKKKIYIVIKTCIYFSCFLFTLKPYFRNKVHLQFFFIFAAVLRKKKKLNKINTLYIYSFWN